MVIFTNNIDIIYELSITKPQLRTYTDHLFIQISTNLQSSTPKISETTDNPKTYRCLNFHNENIDWNKIRSELESVNWEFELSALIPDEMVQKILDISYTIVEKHVPK